MQLLLIKQNKSQLSFIHDSTICESRGASIEKILSDTVKKYKIESDFSFGIGTDDQPLVHNLNFPVYFFSTIENKYDECAPCFSFDSWPEVGINNFYELVNSFIFTHPKSNKIGWVGNPLSLTRQLFCHSYGNTYFSEALTNMWNRDNPKQLFKNCTTYMTFQEQINEWKYLIDFEGVGYSARTKMLLHTPRIVFIVDRPYKEFWYEYLQPWEHYIPVKRDLSDLEKNYHIIENNQDLQNKISDNQQEFCKKYLDYDNVLLQCKKLILKNII